MPFSKIAATVAISALLAACGGGGSDSETVVDPSNGASGGGGDVSTGIGGSPMLGLVGSSNRACNANQGTDASSDDADWSNNCRVEVDPTDDGISETFAQSYYAEGIQRIVWCLGHGAEFDLNTFVDRDFGPRTKAAVESFQQYEGLAVDGIVGSQTWEALQNSLVEVGSDEFSVAWAVGDAFYIETDAPLFENECTDQPAFWEYLAPDADVRAFTLTSRDEDNLNDTTTFGRTDETFFGNTY